MDKDNFPVELSDEMEEKFDEDIDAMEKLVEIVDTGLEDGQSLNDLARADKEALIRDIVLPHLKLYETVEGNFARDTITDAIDDLRDQLNEDNLDEVVQTVDKAIVSWNEQLSDELGIDVDI